MSALQDIFTTGVNAARDVLIARANDPTPNSRGANNVTAPVGQSATGGVAAAVMQPATLLVLAAVGALIFFIARR